MPEMKQPRPQILSTTLTNQWSTEGKTEGIAALEASEQQAEKKYKERKVMVLGERRVGKSMIARQCDETWVDGKREANDKGSRKDEYYAYRPTLFEKRSKKVSFGTEDFNVEILDLGGCPIAADVVGIHGYILVYSPEVHDSFDAVEKIWRHVLALEGIDHSANVLVANKRRQQPGQRRKHRMVRGRELAAKFRGGFVEIDVDEEGSLDVVLQSILEQIEPRPRRARPSFGRLIRSVWS